MLFRLRARPTWPLPGGNSPSATRCRLLLFRLRVRHDLTLPGSNVSYAALCRLLLVRLPSRNTLPLPGGNTSTLPLPEGIAPSAAGSLSLNPFNKYLGSTLV